MSTITVRTQADVEAAERNHPEAELVFDVRKTSTSHPTAIRAREFLERYGNERVTANLDEYLEDVLIHLDDAYFDGTSETYELAQRHSRTGRAELFYA